MLVAKRPDRLHQRTATHVRQGEHLTCVGCHEPKTRVAQAATIVPLALKRPPSKLKPDVDGSAPFSYPRLVQPVLDRHCVQCHQDNLDKQAPNLAREPISKNWYASYNSLVEKYGFYSYGDGYRTTPGKFGAQASKLYQLLREGHLPASKGEGGRSNRRNSLSLLSRRR